MYQLSPSILSADFMKLGKKLKSRKKRESNGFILMLWMEYLYRVFHSNAGDFFSQKKCSLF